jgi:hypothetical protein
VVAKDVKGKGKATDSDAHEESIGMLQLLCAALEADWVRFKAATSGWINMSRSRCRT